EDVEPFENASSAFLQMLLQHVEIDEFDLSLLDGLVDARLRQIHGLAGLEEIQVVEIEQWIVEVAAQMLDRKQLLIGHQIRAMDVSDVRRCGEPLFEIEVANASLDRREFHRRSPKPVLRAVTCDARCSLQRDFSSRTRKRDRWARPRHADKGLAPPR